jgi:site-specific DNA-cytosine methylase
LEPFDPNAPTGHEARLMAEAPSIQRVRHALHRVDPLSSDSVAACFASSYGRSILHAGSYLQTGGGLRRFSPREIARLMGFPESFDLSAAPTHHAAYRLLGNSLSVPVVRQLLAQLIEQLG